LKKITENGWDSNLICIAKTQKSFSDKDALGGIPQDFTLEIRDIEYALGAGFVVPVAGAIMRMPGLPKKPASEGMTIDNNGKISGLS
jgi:formate--tetrahydrofolate ligase